MKRSLLPRSIAALATAFVLGFCALQSPSSAQQNLATVTTQVVSSTASSGTSSTLILDGKYSNCALTAAVSTGTASITINGNTQTGQYGPGAPAVANSNFGTSGVVTVSAATFVTTSGNFANTPVGAYFTWASNSGTLTAWLTCTGANAAGGAVAISSIGPVTISSLPPVSNNCLTNCTPSPTTTVSPGLMVGVTDVCPSTAPAAINGAYTCSITSSGNLNVVQNAAPSATTPVSTPSAAALPTASAGVAPPAQAPQVSDFPACEYAGLLAVLSGQNFITIQCDVTGRVFVNSDDPSMTFNSAALASATTMVLKTGVATKQLYIYLATWESTGTNSSNTIQWEYSTNATCSSGNTSLLPAAIAPGTATGEWTSLWGIQAVSNTTVGGMPGANGKALVLPAGNTFCGVTAGTTTAGSFVTVVGIH